ncbi:MAG: transcription antitermination factor NusB [Myxococcota bacterium]
MKPRRIARECALMILYGMDVTGQRSDWALARFWRIFADDPNLDPPPAYRVDEPGYAIETGPEARRYAEVLVRGVETERTAVDAAVQRASQHWRMERMATVDRNLLRLGAFELLFRGDVPRKVVLNESVELAKRFGAQEARAFVNGVLDRVQREGHRAV